MDDQCVMCHNQMSHSDDGVVQSIVIGSNLAIRTRTNMSEKLMVTTNSIQRCSDKIVIRPKPGHDK